MAGRAPDAVRTVGWIGGALRKIAWPVAVMALAPTSAVAAPTFKANTPIEANAGHAMLEWNADGMVRLEMARDTSFSEAAPLYQGDYDSYFVSGLSDGDYYVRLRGQDGGTSEPLRIHVAHQSLTQAIWLMIIGAIISIGIITTIVRGARDE